MNILIETGEAIATHLLPQYVIIWRDWKVKAKRTENRFWLTNGRSRKKIERPMREDVRLINYLNFTLLMFLTLIFLDLKVR